MQFQEHSSKKRKNKQQSSNDGKVIHSLPKKKKQNKILFQENEIETSIMICTYRGFETLLLREEREDRSFFISPNCPEFITILVQHKNEETIIDLSGLYYFNNVCSYIYEKSKEKKYEIFHDMNDDIWLIIRHIVGKDPVIVYQAKSNITNSFYPPKYGWVRK